jgi:hypothetical protein
MKRLYVVVGHGRYSMVLAPQDHLGMGHPIDPAGPTFNGQTVLRDFCSSRMPRLQSLPANGGCIAIEIQDDASRLTCITGRRATRGATPLRRA